MIEAPIQNLFPIEDLPRSSIFSDGMTTHRLRSSEDYIDPFRRWEIDRGIPPGMKDESGNSILTSLFERVSDQGSISILDAGCGTGRAVHEIRGQLIYRTIARQDDVLATGISNIDFSQDSANLSVREAISRGAIKYIVDDIATAKLEPESFDCIYSFEAFIYNDPQKVIEMIKNLMPSLKPDGFLLFNLKESQRNSEALNEYFNNGKENSFTCFEYKVDHGKMRRSFVLLRPIPSNQSQLI